MGAMRLTKFLYFRFFFIIGVLFIFPSFSAALEPHEVLVLANKNATGSVGLAQYYMKRRGIPEHNLLMLRVTDSEVCSREDYDKKVVNPVRKYFKRKDPDRRIRCIVTMFGLPLKVSPPETTRQEQKELKKLLKRQDALKKNLARLTDKKGKESKDIERELKGIGFRISDLKKTGYGASLDSEIALVLREDYILSKWISNPYFVEYRGREMMAMREDVLIVSRLDGPSEGIVRRIIDDSIATEKTGLKGKAYFDARWPRPSENQGEKTGFGYEFYDRSIYLAAEEVKKIGRMPVVVNDKPELFQPGECPEAALYCGWYSLAQYVDAFDWRPGSVGYHIASAECRTLKQPGSQVWCKKMLEKGVTAAIGPVNEPYVQAFPIPGLFFRFLLDGFWTLAECYALSQPFWSWQMVLIGDPLYRPFGR
jgi:uncharacterized protein (TIGR03790 family)